MYIIYFSSMAFYYIGEEETQARAHEHDILALLLLIASSMRQHFYELSVCFLLYVYDS